MLMKIPTYNVVFKTKGGNHSVSLRVPRTQLEAFVQALIFNDIDFEVAAEPEPELNINAQASQKPWVQGTPGFSHPPQR